MSRAGGSRGPSGPSRSGPSPALNPNRAGVPWGGSANGVKGPTFVGGNGKDILSVGSGGRLANPTRAVQHQANNGGALTRAEAAMIGLQLSGRPGLPPSRALPGFPN